MFFYVHDIHRKKLYSEDVPPNDSIDYINTHELILNQ